MQAALPPNMNEQPFLGPYPFWAWLQDHGQRITPQTMRNITAGQHLILGRAGHMPLLVTAQHDAGPQVELVGLHLRGVGYNNIVNPGNIHQGVWDLYEMPNQVAELIVQAPAAAPAFHMPALPPAAAAGAPAAAAGAAFGFHMPAALPAPGAPDIYAGIAHSAAPPIPANSENILLGTPIVAGLEMVNLRGPDGRWNSSLEEPRFYTYETFRQMPLKQFPAGRFKEHPFTRSPLRPENVRRFRATGGKSKRRRGRKTMRRK